jgi:DnaJ-class molecular chaperone
MSGYNFAGFFQSPRWAKKSASADSSDDGGRSQAKEYMLKARSRYQATNPNLKQIDDWYEILGLDSTASQGDIKKKYLKLALVLHPDRHGRTPVKSAEKILHGASSDWDLVRKAYATLGRAEERSR